MIAILSPARNTQPVEGYAGPVSQPVFAAETMELVALMREYSPWQLESLLDVPEKRSFALYDAYQRLDAFKGEMPALLAYQGAAYRNMRPQGFDGDALLFAHGHIRILSALYGMLRPLDGIAEHRLGLKKQFSPYGADLHAYWGDRLYKELFRSGELVVDLASQEYSKLVTRFMKPGDRMVTCRFLVDKPGGPKGTVSTVRAARGLMARFIVENRIDDPEDLKSFEADGYEFVRGRSTGEELVFVKRKAGFSPELLSWGSQF